MTTALMEESIRTWAEECNIDLTNTQVLELCYSIEQVYDMEMNAHIMPQMIETDDRREIKRLKEIIDILSRHFHERTGRAITFNEFGNHSVTEHYMEQGPYHSASASKTYHY
jgi:D-tyrosyl-tRNA(Tyr) deacylase